MQVEAVEGAGEEGEVLSLVAVAAGAGVAGRLRLLCKMWGSNRGCC
jgi:hypothetical protein